MIESLEADGANILEVAPSLDPIAFGAQGHSHHDEDDNEGASTPGECDPDAGHEEGDHDDEDGHAHEEGGCDPHVWMDPLRVATAVELIAEELSALDQSVDWMANTLPYADELRTLDEEVVALLEVVPEERRKMVTNHEAFGYFADRYGFEVVGVVIPGGSTLADPSSAELAELVEIMTEENIDVIFGETVGHRPWAMPLPPKWEPMSRWSSCSPGRWVAPALVPRHTSTCSAPTQRSLQKHSPEFGQDSRCSRVAPGSGRPGTGAAAAMAIDGGIVHERTHTGSTQANGSPCAERRHRSPTTPRQLRPLIENNAAKLLGDIEAVEIPHIGRIT